MHHPAVCPPNSIRIAASAQNTPKEEPCSPSLRALTVDTDNSFILHLTTCKSQRAAPAGTTEIPWQRLGSQLAAENPSPYLPGAHPSWRVAEHHPAFSASNLKRFWIGLDSPPCSLSAHRVQKVRQRELLEEKYYFILFANRPPVTGTLA